MNNLTIIGNLTRDPETRTTSTGKDVCSFAVAVNRRGKDAEADYFRVSVWDKLADNCQRYLAKGRKVAVTGPVSIGTYDGKDGKTHANLEVTARDVEFLTPRGDDGGKHYPSGVAYSSAGAANDDGISDGYTEVDDDDLPF